ncbi:hypothetical protein CK203_081688 [Vitis vinifera]|uniref:Uncharacterized protein n=1 Tax=Vitis vinifera TaxID=29760 RepID=A0A438DPR3_VITVI|nr:hypothetical protein CK203_081688 [Vitis vinifera]
MADRENLSRLWQLGLTGASMESFRRGTTCLKNEHSFHLECWRTSHESLDGGYNPRIQHFALCPHEPYGWLLAIKSHHQRLLTCYISQCVLEMEKNMGSSTLYYLFMFMRFLVLLSGFHLMVTDSSPSVVQHPLCHGSDSSALLEFKQSF